MSETAAAGLGEALRERLQDRLRLIDRAQALEGHPRGSEAEAGAGAEALLRAALRALGGAECYALAARVISGEAVSGGGVAEWTALQELAQAGLVTWDLGSGRVCASPLLVELHAVLDSAVRKASR